jgi:hypothetical protein
MEGGREGSGGRAQWTWEWDPRGGREGLGWLEGWRRNVRGVGGGSRMVGAIRAGTIPAIRRCDPAFYEGFVGS